MPPTAPATPLFRQLTDRIRARIESGELKPGDKLPSIAELCDKHKVSAITVRRALTELASEGLVRGAQGKGVFIAQPAKAVGNGQVALVIPDFTTSPFFAGIMYGVEQTFGRDRDLVVGVNQLDPDREIEILRGFFARGVHAALLTPATVGRSPMHDTAVAELVERGLRLVLVDRDIHGLAVDRISSDNHMAGRIAGEHLAGLGHRRVAFVYGHDCSTCTDRLAGLTEALSAAGGGLEAQYVRGGGQTKDYEGAGYLRTLELFHLAEPPTAIFAANEPTTVGVLRALRFLGRSVPGQVSVVGNDDLVNAALLDPPLTCVRQDVFAMGQQAAKLLESRLADPAQPPRTVKVPVELALRASTTRIG
jgi:LacI family transcriptional regulator